MVLGQRPKDKSVNISFRPAARASIQPRRRDRPTSRPGVFAARSNTLGIRCIATELNVRIASESPTARPGWCRSDHAGRKISPLLGKTSITRVPRSRYETSSCTRSRALAT